MTTSYRASQALLFILGATSVAFCTGWFLNI
jgi:hypothetical protein